MKIKVTFAVCTYNRAFILPQCLESILAQIKDYPHSELLLINNNSTDNTAALVKDLQVSHPQLNYVFESNPGLSHARNRACQAAKGEWIVFIDDDAKLRTGYIERLFHNLENYDFDCFGGMYYAWFPFGTTQWLPKSFGNKKLIRSDVGPIDGKGELLSGGNLAIRNKVLERVGGFDSGLGMHAEKIVYGEEDDLQIRLLEAGYKIGFDPELIIDHAVLPQKLKLSWHLKSSFGQGVTNEQLAANQRSTAQLFIRLIKSILGLLLKRLPLGFWKWITRNDYYWQNLVLDSLQPIYKAAGALSSKLS